MKQFGTQAGPKRGMGRAWMLAAVLTMPGVGVAATAPALHRDSAVMMLALPGRGDIVSAPGETATIVIENASGQVCKIVKVRSGPGGVVEVPVAQTRRCRSPRIVVHR